MLLNDLYTIESLTESQHVIQATVLLRKDHEIFKGHFPGQPVLPGVCMMEMISEITGEQLKKKFRISGGPLIKFLRMIDPEQNAEISLDIKYQNTYSHTHISGKIFSSSVVFMKFQLSLIFDPIQ